MDSSLRPPSVTETSAEPAIAADGATGAIQLVTLLLRNVRLMAGLAIAAAVVVGAFSMMQARTFTSSASFAPQSATPDRAGVASLAASFGIAIGGASTAESPQFYADLLMSDEILRRVAMLSYEADAATKTPVPLAGLLKVTLSDPDRSLEETLTRLRRMIVVRPNLRTSVVGVSVTAPSPALAQQLADSLLSSVNAFNLKSQQSRASAERHFAEGRLREYQAGLAAAEDEYEEFLRANRVINSPGLQLQSNRLQRHINMLQTVVTSLTSATEQARIDEVRSTPAIRVVESPRAPVNPNARGTVKKAALASMLGVLLGLVYLVLIERLRYARSAGDASIEELLKAARRFVPGRRGRQG